MSQDRIEEIIAALARLDLSDRDLLDSALPAVAALAGLRGARPETCVAALAAQLVTSAAELPPGDAPVTPWRLALWEVLRAIGSIVSPEMAGQALAVVVAAQAHESHGAAGAAAALRTMADTLEREGGGGPAAGRA